MVFHLTPRHAMAILGNYPASRVVFPEAMRHKMKQVVGANSRCSFIIIYPNLFNVVKYGQFVNPIINNPQVITFLMGVIDHQHMGDSEDCFMNINRIDSLAFMMGQLPKRARLKPRQIDHGPMAPMAGSSF